MLIESFKKAWRGEEKLWKVFWLWGVLGNVVWWWLHNFFIIDYVRIEFGNKDFLVGALYIFFYLSYVIFSFLVAWKNSFNLKIQKLGYILRTFLVVFSLLGLLAVGSILVLMKFYKH